MGTGKSSIGKFLSTLTSYQFIDLDEKIENDTGMSISDFFQKYGEVKFRNLESQTLLQISQKSHQIVSLGGGCVLKQSNREILNQGVWINFHSSFHSILKRVNNTPQTRPLVHQSTNEDLYRIWMKRLPLYKLAPLQVDTSFFSPLFIAKQIKQKLNPIL